MPNPYTKETYLTVTSSSSTLYISLMQTPLWWFFDFTLCTIVIQTLNLNAPSFCKVKQCSELFSICFMSFLFLYKCLIQRYVWLNINFGWEYQLSFIVSDDQIIVWVFRRIGQKIVCLIQKISPCKEMQTQNHCNHVKMHISPVHKTK